MKHNEDTRVKIPTILHLTRLGYEYLSLKNANWDEDTNIFPDIFQESLQRINPEIDKSQIDRAFEDIKLALDNEDLGKAFYEILVERSGLKLIDFENFDNNSFHVVTELPCKNGDDEFRPDITLLINGMPLVFIEVKKPNNKEGILAEHRRMEQRFENPKFRRFINITQIMVFSNNMEYNDDSPAPIEGAFYASTAYRKPVFNYFREEEALDLSVILSPPNDVIENDVLQDTNLNVIKNHPEFATNKEPDTPTNRICTSLFSRERISFLLQYAIAYVNETNGLEKHIMRYPQIFATKAIEEELESGTRNGIIWHTQGSGKTALAYYNVKHLTDYFSQKGVIPKFYFIVDRIDLLIQAKREFTSRGLVVHTIASREDFAKDIKSTGVIHNLSGNPEITVVNIQKFEDDPDVVKTEDYDLSIQRVYFLDEVHRSYSPKGSFLANLTQSDKNAIKIGLTGTPLLGNDYNSRLLFGDYIHTYYYNKSIADGYTLRLIREEIAAKYRVSLQQALDDIQVREGDIDKRHLFAHPRFVEPMLDYIIEDFENSRIAHGDNSIGGMVICDSSDQAKKMFEMFEQKYASDSKNQDVKVKSAALILHDVGSKDERKDKVEEFKAGNIDFLIVFNMLLTGFDAKRLKKLYIGRVIKRHNLLQALTRVNRRYKDFQYGFVVDFADIRKEFDATNKAYFDELQSELGDEMEHYSNIFKSKEEIEEEIENIKDVLFRFDTTNAEVFSQQISQIQDREELRKIKRALNDAKGLYNLIRLFGHYGIVDKLDFRKLTILFREVSNHLDLVNLKEKLENSSDSINLINVALEDVIFKFQKIGEEELVLADQLKNTLRRTREALAGNFDTKDKQFISLKDELERLFKKKNLSEVTQEEMNANIKALEGIHSRVKELNRQNNLIKTKYGEDVKYARVHKRLVESGKIKESERRIHSALTGVKGVADEEVLKNTQILDNESYFERVTMPLIIDEFKSKNKIDLDASLSRYINGLIVKEYMNEFSGARL
ncbi:type I restriction endonuclease subunit R [Litorimonas sp. WD9-15]|uniref:type I restriction endonuclease subunit R n=1 Tax=Litorimonas sp. WD9-15 TaxID=3418716 RepID=UPI003D060EE7